MVFLLLFIFFIVLIFAILPEILPGISRKVVDLVVQEDDRESQLRRDLNQLQQDLKAINMVDNFAQYAKTERKLNKVKEELSKYKKSKSEVFLKLKFGTNIMFHIVQLGVMLSLIWTYRSSPLLVLPEGWFFPLSRFIAFPTGVSGGIGITAWLVVCRSVVRKILQVAGKS